MHGIEDVVDDVQQVICRALDVLEITQVVFVQLAEHLAFGDFRKTDNGVERRAQFVAHLAEKFRFRRHGEPGFIQREIELHIAFPQFLQTGFKFALRPPRALDRVVFVGDVRPGAAVADKIAGAVPIDRHAAERNAPHPVMIIGNQENTAAECRSCFEQIRFSAQTVAGLFEDAERKNIPADQRPGRYFKRFGYARGHIGQIQIHIRFPYPVRCRSDDVLETRFGLRGADGGLGLQRHVGIDAGVTGLSAIPGRADMERSVMFGVAADLDGLAEFDFADAFFEMAEYPEQLFRRVNISRVIALHAENGGDEFLEFRAEQGKPAACVGNIDRRHAVEQVGWEEDLCGPGGSAVRCRDQSGFDLHDSFRSVVQDCFPTVCFQRKCILLAAVSWCDGQMRFAFSPSFPTLCAV